MNSKCGVLNLKGKGREGLPVIKWLLGAKHCDMYECVYEFYLILPVTHFIDNQLREIIHFSNKHATIVSGYWIRWRLSLRALKKISSTSKIMVDLERARRQQRLPQSRDPPSTHTQYLVHYTRTSRFYLNDESQRVAVAQPRGRGGGRRSANPTERIIPGTAPARATLTWDIKMKKCLCLKPF